MGGVRTAEEVIYNLDAIIVKVEQGKHAIHSSALTHCQVSLSPKHQLIEKKEMIGFYDYLFYFIYKFYSPKEKGAATTSAMIIGALQAINVLSILMLSLFFSSEKRHLSTISFIVVLCFFQVLNYIRYIYREKVTIHDMAERWQRRSEAQKTRIRALSLLYIALSIGAFFGLAIYGGSRN